MTPYLRTRVGKRGWTDRQDPDAALIVVTILLVALGVVMVYSASSALGWKKHQDELYYVKRQLFRAGVGVMAMIVIAMIDPNRIRKHARKILIFALLLLGLVLVPGIGIESRSAQRWLPLGFTTFQPAELTKLAVVIYLADFMTRHEERLRSFSRGLLPPLVVLGFVAILILLQPSLGAVVLLALITGTLLFVGGARLHHLLLVGAVGGAVAVGSVLSHPYQWERVQSFLDHETDQSGEEYQVYQGMLAMGSGGAFGKGFGHSQQKLFFLPDAHTDFIMAIVGEEGGFLGAALVIVLFLILFQRGLAISWRSHSRYVKLLAFGLTASIFYQATLNLLVVTHLIPTTGQPLPFLSYGGSNLTFAMVHVGLLLSLSRLPLLHSQVEAPRARRSHLYDDGMPSRSDFLTP